MGILDYQEEGMAMSITPKDSGQLWFKGKLVTLIIREIIEFHDLSPTEAIQRVKGCVGLSEYDRQHIALAIYSKTDPPTNDPTIGRESRL